MTLDNDDADVQLLVVLKVVILMCGSNQLP